MKANLLDVRGGLEFNWPEWLPKEPLCVDSALSNYGDQFSGLRGKVDLLVGGPPCQGYSSAGRRVPGDPRNKLFESYLQLVELFAPRMILLENVRGITIDFRDTVGGDSVTNYAERLESSLERDYAVYARMLNLAEFGVPQSRVRYFLIGLRRDSFDATDLLKSPFQVLDSHRHEFLLDKGLSVPVSAKSAISDLEITRNGSVPSSDTPGFEAIAYKEPRTHYQRMLRSGFQGAPSDTRLARHRPDIEKRFREIIDLCHATGRLNVSLSQEARAAYALKSARFVYSIRIAHRLLSRACLMTFYTIPNQEP